MAQPDMESNMNLDLPSVSKPGAGDGEPIAMIPPRIEGYEILSPLGQAGQGQVWRAVQMGTHRHVAIKIPHIRFIASRKSLLRFEREVELAARLEHRNIAHIYESGIHQGFYYYAMEFIDGVHLDAYVQDRHLSVRQTVELMRTVCAAVQYAHQKGIIHRDLKPSNILVTQDGQPYLLDFGLARSVLTDKEDPAISTEGELAGTPAYMSPEQAQGQHDQLDTRTDVYSLGIILYRLLTRQFPYPVDHSVAETLSNIIQTEPIRPCRIAKQLDHELECIILKALAKEPEQRYQSAAELRADLDNWLQGFPITAKSGQTLYVLKKVITRHKKAVLTAGLMAVIVVSYFFVSLDFYLQKIKALRELEPVIQQIQETDSELVHASVFCTFMEQWQKSNSDNARSMYSIMTQDDGKESRAVRFLLDPSPLESKETDFRAAMPDTPWFADLVIGVHCRHQNEPSRALGQFQNSRAGMLGSEALNESDFWYLGRVVVWISELSDPNGGS